VVTWGDPEAGGDSSSVQDKLKNVKARGEAVPQKWGSLAKVETPGIHWKKANE